MLIWFWASRIVECLDLGLLDTVLYVIESRMKVPKNMLQLCVYISTGSSNVYMYICDIAAEPGWYRAGAELVGPARLPL